MLKKIKNPLLTCIGMVLITNAFADPTAISAREPVLDAIEVSEPFPAPLPATVPVSVHALTTGSASATPAPASTIVPATAPVKQPVDSKLLVFIKSLVESLTTPAPVAATNNQTSVAPAIVPTPSQQPNIIELPVNDYGDVERQQNFTKALSLVLTKNSNNPKITDLLEIKAALAKPTLYVQQYNYVNRTVAPGKQALFLQINFDPKAITLLLQRASKVMLVSNKPLILMWLTKDVVGGKILDDENDSEMMNIVRRKAREVGLAIMLPALDLQDINAIKSYDICSLNAPMIKKASLRYGASGIVMGCIRPSVLGSVWTSKWLLLQGEKSNRFNFVGSSAEEVITQAMQGVAANVTGVVTPIVGGATKVVLRITDVNGLDQYNEIVRYLHTFKQVTQVDLVNISATEIEMTVNIIGGQQALITLLSNDNKLVPNTDITMSPAGIDLDYKWVTLENEQSQTTNPQPLF